MYEIYIHIQTPYEKLIMTTNSLDAAGNKAYELWKHDKDIIIGVFDTFIQEYIITYNWSV